MSLRKCLICYTERRRAKSCAARSAIGEDSVRSTRPHRNDARPHPDVRRIPPRSGQRPPVSRRRDRGARAEGVCAAAVPGRAGRPAGLEAGVAGGGLAGRVRRRRGAEEHDSRAAQGARRRFARAALHRDRASPRLSVHGAGHRDRAGRRPPCRGHAARQLRAQRQRQHRLPGDRLGPDRSRVRDGVGVAPRILLERAVVRAFPDAARARWRA